MTHDEEAERQRCRRLLGGAPIGFLLCGAGWVLVSAAADRNFLSRPARAGRSRRTARWPGRGARSRFTLGAWRSSSPRPSTGACGERMLLACEAQRRLFGVDEVDESFFGARRLRQDRRLRHLRAAGPRLYRARPGLLNAHPPGHHPRVGSTRAPSSTPMAGAATTAWSTSAMATSASTMPATRAPKAPSISPASKASGA